MFVLEAIVLFDAGEFKLPLLLNDCNLSWDERRFCSAAWDFTVGNGKGFWNFLFLSWLSGFDLLFSGDTLVLNPVETGDSIN